MPCNVEIKARLSNRQRGITVAKELSGKEGIAFSHSEAVQFGMYIVLVIVTWSQPLFQGSFIHIFTFY